LSAAVNLRRLRGPPDLGYSGSIRSLSPSIAEAVMVLIVCVDPYLALRQAGLL
jgi:hypothetical protein